MNKTRIVYLGNLSSVASWLSVEDRFDLAGWIVEDADAADSGIQHLCSEREIPLYPVKTDVCVGRALEEIRPADLGVIANFGILLSKGNLEKTRLGFVNAHPGCLPEYPGRRPVSKAVRAGEPVCGMTLHWAVEEADKGPVIDRCLLSVGPRRDPAEVFERLVSWIPDLLNKNLPSLLRDTVPA